MSVLVPTQPNPLAPVVGTPAVWSRDFAIFGGLLPLAAILPSVPLGFGSNLLVLCSAGALGGALLGLGTPTALDWVRGKVPISLLFITATLIGATWGMLAGSLVSDELVLWGIAVQGPIVGLVWLPYTMATVLGRRAWPILALGLMFAAPITLLVIGIFNALALILAL